MQIQDRRQFLQSAAVLAAAAMLGSSFDTAVKQKRLLSFSTLGCPDWSFDQIVEFAVKHQYQGIEVRGIKRQLDLPQCPEFNTAAARKESLQKMKDRQLRFVDLGSSATLHFSNSAERQKNIDDGKRFLDLAHAIECPYIRVYPNNFPKERDKQATMELISKGLIELGDHSKGSGVKVLIETHGDMLWIADIDKIMQMTNHPQVGIVWDIYNMWTITKESPADAYKKLKKYIYHTHIKDGRWVEGKWKFTFLGRGEVPLAEALKALQKGGYRGYYSFEWEKLWHPEIEEPEAALTDYVVEINKY